MRLIPLALLVVIGCSAPRDPAALGPQARPSALTYEVTVDSLEDAASSLARLAVGARAMVGVGLTPLASPLLSTPESRFTLPAVSGPLALGLIPGGDPLLRSELVVVGADVDTPSAAVVLEAARALVERSQWTDVPGRSVQIALWSGAASRSRALSAPLWRRDAVYAVLEVGEPPSRADDAVEYIVGAAGLDLSAVVLARVLEVASEPAVSDSLVSR
ncbi:hypothetical protein [Rubrivirga sp.]|uniref:hypothetical protein n=1 Tax=Rubrivirga sp. TaxID=1885344 RepID=UPI003C7784C0